MIIIKKKIITIYLGFSQHVISDINVINTDEIKNNNR